MRFNKVKNKKKFILLGYRDKAIKLYTPKRNKFKLCLLWGLFIGWLMTPLTNGLIVLVGFALNKYPLWVFK